MKNSNGTDELCKIVVIREEYENYCPSDREYYAEETPWKDRWIAVGKNKEEAFVDFYLNQLPIHINWGAYYDHKIPKEQLEYEAERKLEERKREVENLTFNDNNAAFGFKIVKTEKAIMGLDCLPENLEVVDETETKTPWGSDGDCRETISLFNDGFEIIDKCNSAPGWFESEKLLIHKEKGIKVLLHSHGEDIYNKGDTVVEEIQRGRENLISEYREKLNEIKRKKSQNMKECQITTALAFKEKLYSFGY